MSVLFSPWPSLLGQSAQPDDMVLYRVHSHCSMSIMVVQYLLLGKRSKLSSTIPITKEMNTQSHLGLIRTVSVASCSDVCLFPPPGSSVENYKP